MNNETKIALLELEHRYGKEVRDRVEQMGFVIPKHGHWIEIEDVIITGKCSVCGWSAIFAETDVVGMPYCPNCGAKMEGEEDDLQSMGMSRSGI